MWFQALDVTVPTGMLLTFMFVIGGAFTIFAWSRVTPDRKPDGSLSPAGRLLFRSRLLVTGSIVAYAVSDLIRWLSDPTKPDLALRYPYALLWELFLSATALCLGTLDAYNGRGQGKRQMQIGSTILAAIGVIGFLVIAHGVGEQ